MNALVTLNVHSFLPEKARASFKNAADRWGVRYIEITEPLAAVHPFWQKCLVATSHHTGGLDRVLQLDADMLVRSDCPNPFNMVPSDHFGVVSRVQPGRPKWLSAPNCGKRFAKVFDLAPYERPEEHLNAGFILYNPSAHQDILIRWREAGAYSGWRNVGFPEQMALSCILHQHTESVTWMPWQFNACSIGRRRLELPPGPMLAYIYHFHRPRPLGLAETMELYQWQV